MAYIKQNFVDGMVLKAEHLNDMDNQIATNETSVSEIKNKMTNQTWSLDFGTLIAEGADLNTLTEVGNYYSPTTTRTATLLNCPFSSYGFSLKVYSPTNGTGYIRQEITTTRVSDALQPTNSGYSLVRHGVKSNGAWQFSGWTKVSMYPSLTTEQKTKMVELMDQYYRVRNTLFCYTLSARRQMYAYPKSSTAWGYGDDLPEACVLEKDGSFKYMLNCGTFCQMIWMGRPISDFLPGTTPAETKLLEQAESGKNTLTDSEISALTLTSKPSISADIHSTFINESNNTKWGYYFKFLLSQKVFNLRKANGKLYGYNSYPSDTELTGDRLEKYPDQLIPLTFDGAAYLAEELYRMGCEIPPEEMDVGDLVFFKAKDIRDETKNNLTNRAFRNIDHVGIVYAMNDGEPTIIDCTNVYEEDNVVIDKVSLNDTDPFKVAKAAHHYNQTVMVARHPAAYGLGGNVPNKFTTYRRES